jgi:hypothetical protein
VAENTTDGVVAPLFYTALAGPVGLWVYKAVSTLDSMVGYRTPRYLRFGWASARMDDVLNFLPARLTYLLMPLAALLTGRNSRQALRIGWRDGRKHPSPNSAWAEAAMAGALGVQLGGSSTYQRLPSEKAHLGDPGEPLTLDKARQAIRLMTAAAWLALAFSSLFVAFRCHALPCIAQMAGGVATQGNAMQNAFRCPILAFWRNWNPFLNLCRARRREETNLRPVTRGNSRDAKFGSHVLVSEGVAEMTSRAPP